MRAAPVATWGVSSSFGKMEDLFREWLAGAQPTEIHRLRDHRPLRRARAGVSPGRRDMRPPDCRALGLTRDQAAALTGFSGRAVAALAHLREAWCVADPHNHAAIAAALRALCQGSHSLRDVPGLCRRVLTVGLDPGQAVTIERDAGYEIRDGLERRRTGDTP